MRIKAHQHKRKNGQIVPGATSVIGNNLGWNKNILIQWARREALAGHDPTLVIDKSKLIGLATHQLIQNDLQKKAKKMDYPPSVMVVANKYYREFKAFEEQYVFKYKYIEKELIHPTMDYGGTIDAIAYDENELSYCLLDWKSGRNIYPENWMQMAAYVHLIKDCLDVNIRRIYLVHLAGRGGMDIHIKHDSELKHYWMVFQNLLALQNLRTLI